MKKLNDILNGIKIVERFGSSNPEIKKIVFDSREVEANSLFFAIKGTQVDGHRFVEMAVKSGASAIVCEEVPAEKNENVVYLKVENSQHALGIITGNFYDYPSEKFKLVGVTGTNGKTTIASVLYKLFGKLGYNVGLLSTIENRINDEVIEATHTTPDVVQINRLLAKMIEAGVDYCFMEVSSHAIDQERVSGLHFTGGIFTNLTHDHLDYHKDFKSYLAAKKKFFDDLPASAFALTNLDDKNGRVMQQNTRAAKYSYGLTVASDFYCKIIENQFDGLQLMIEGQPVWFRLVGKFNAYNLMAVYAAAVLLGENKMEVLTQLSLLEPAEGRFELMKSEEGISVIIDYAHTPDALKNVLETISATRTGNETLITLVGAGGNRDKTKRPLMAKVACDKSDKLILTSDNPRDEDPDAIIEDMKTGLDIIEKKKVLSITNRVEAIKTALALAKKGDIILIAGKGHEKYQVLKGGKIIPLDEKQIVREILTII